MHCYNTEERAKWVNVARVQVGQSTDNKAATLDQYQIQLLIIITTF